METAPPDTFANLAAAYTAFWLILAFFVARLHRRQTALRTELASVRRQLTKAESRRRAALTPPFEPCYISLTPPRQQSLNSLRRALYGRSRSKPGN